MTALVKRKVIAKNAYFRKDGYVVNLAREAI